MSISSCCSLFLVVGLDNCVLRDVVALEREEKREETGRTQEKSFTFSTLRDFDFGATMFLF